MALALGLRVVQGGRQADHWRDRRVQDRQATALLRSAAGELARPGALEPDSRAEALAAALAAATARVGVLESETPAFAMAGSGGPAVQVQARRYSPRQNKGVLRLAVEVPPPPGATGRSRTYAADHEFSLVVDLDFGRGLRLAPDPMARWDS